MRFLPATTPDRVRALGRGLDPSLALLAAIAFMTQIGVAVMLPLLPIFASRLGAPPLVLGLLTSSFALTNAAGQLLAGFVGQRIGPRRLVPSGMALYAGANVLIATAGAALPLIVWRSVAGLGAGLGLVSERLYITQVIDRARLAFANGLLSAAGSAGTVAGPAIGGLLAAASDIRTPFLLVALTSGLAAAAALFLPKPRAVDEAAAAIEHAAAAAAPGNRRVLVALLIANIGLLACFGSFITTYGPYATTVLGWSEASVGLQFSAFGLGSILLGPWLAHLADRRGRRRIALFACVPIVVFAIALVAGAPELVIGVLGVGVGAGIAGFESAWYALLATATGGVRGGRAFGTISAISNLGIVAGAMVAANLWEFIDIRAGVATLALAAGVAIAGMAALPPDRGAADDEPAGRTEPVPAS